MKNPTDLKYTPDHMWVRIEAGNVASMGVTYFGQEGMGEILYVELPEIGKYLKKEEFLCTLSSPKAMVDLSSPLSGEVVAVNEDLLINPNVVNESPYERGWLLRLKDCKLEELADLMNSEAYEGLIAS